MSDVQSLNLLRFDVKAGQLGEPVAVTRMIVSLPTDIDEDSPHNKQAIYSVWKFVKKPQNAEDVLASISTFNEFTNHAFQVMVLFRENRARLVELIHKTYPESSVGMVTTYSINLLSAGYVAWWKTEGQHLEPQQIKEIKVGQAFYGKMQ